jgi:cytochrome c oxidase assembly protein subunit 11
VVWWLYPDYNFVAMNATPHRRQVRFLLLLTVAMFGFGFAMAPIYNVMCRVLGINGKPSGMAVAAPSAQLVDESRWVTVQFVASLNESLPLDFAPETYQIKVHPGQLYTVSYTANNRLAVPLNGQAVPSVAPGVAAEFFKKTECFCFTPQAFLPGQPRELPVRFYLDPGLPKHIQTVTLSYTFFKI